MKTAFPSLRSPVTITLYCNIPFDNTYKHHTIISELFTYNNVRIYQTGQGTSDIPPKERFIERRKPENLDEYYYKRWTMTGEYNFNYSNGLVSSVTLELTPEQTNANYMKVKCGNDIYYYFITSITQSNYETYNLSLELDVLMTYQDEFLSGLKDMPVSTIRKHCHRYTNDGLMPKCADFKTGEPAFANVKPSLIESVTKLHYANNDMKNLEDIVWLYICIDNLPNIAGEQYQEINERFKVLSMYKNREKPYPLTMMCVPINVDSVTYIYKIEGSNINVTFTKDDITKGIRKLVNDGKIHGAKVSPYPPFTSTQNITRNNYNIVIEPDLTIVETTTGLGRIVSQVYGGTRVMMGNITNQHQIYTDLGIHGELMFSHGFMIIEHQYDCNYSYDDITSQLMFSNTSSPFPWLPRFNEPKLLFNPFRKYVISSQYSGDGCEFYPELIFSNYTTANDGEYFSFETTATAYIGDNNFYTKVKTNYSDYPVFNNYKYEKIGLSSCVNYVFPCGENALDAFNSTQASTFYQSKMATGITSGLTIAGGIASTIIGIVGAVASEGMSAPMSAGMIAGGMGAISSGIAGEVTNAKSITAKLEDLKNTPNSINISGSNFITDENIVLDSNSLPYIVKYECSPVIYEGANDFFYNYGYQVSRDCYFNTELSYDNSGVGKVDNDLLGRTLFNYVQLNEDIVNKINSDIPLLVKKKLSSIFNNGITLWSFFGLSELWENTFIPQTIYIDDAFLKHKLDNTEYSILMTNN